MSDIVERLRDAKSNWKIGVEICDQAADEIERLRTALEGRINVATNLLMECDRLRAEIIALRAEAGHRYREGYDNALAECHLQIEEWNGKHQIACMEIDRLRAGLEQIARDFKQTTFGNWPTKGSEIARATLKINP